MLAIGCPIVARFVQIFLINLATLLPHTSADDGRAKPETSATG